MAGETYRLENPYPIVLDLRKGRSQSGIDDSSQVRETVISERPSFGPGMAGKNPEPRANDFRRETTLAIRESRIFCPHVWGPGVLTRYAIHGAASISAQPLQSYKAELFSDSSECLAVRGAHGSETYFSRRSVGRFERNPPTRDPPSAGTTRRVRRRCALS